MGFTLFSWVCSASESSSMGEGWVAKEESVTTCKCVSKCRADERVLLAFVIEV